MNFEEMEYLPKMTKKILCDSSYLGCRFLIVSYGTHPCAYIEIPKDHKWFGIDYDDEELNHIECHGGITFSGDLSHILEKTGKWFIGWDYAHIEDYDGLLCNLNNYPFRDIRCKKWTTQEIYEEVKKVIESIKEDLQ